MAALLCAQCSAPLSMEAAQGRAPCGYCNVINAAPGNPYGPQADLKRALQASRQQGPAWICPECRKENQAHYKFCLGCGSLAEASTTGPGANTFATPRRSSVALIAGIVAAAAVVGVLALVAALVLAR